MAECGVCCASQVVARGRSSTRRGALGARRADSQKRSTEQITSTKTLTSMQWRSAILHRSTIGYTVQRRRCPLLLRALGGQPAAARSLSGSGCGAAWFGLARVIGSNDMLHLNRALAWARRWWWWWPRPRPVRADARRVPRHPTGRPSAARLRTCTCGTRLLLPPVLRSGRRTAEAFPRMRTVEVGEVLATAVHKLAAPFAPHFIRRKQCWHRRRPQLSPTAALNAHVAVRVVSSIDHRAANCVLLCWSEGIANLYVVLWVPVPTTCRTDTRNRVVSVRVPRSAGSARVFAYAPSSHPRDAMK